MVSLLRAWIDEPVAGASGAKPTTTSTPINTTEFRSACERDLRVGVLRMRLYLEDEKTVNVLLTHVRDRIVEEYAFFRSMMWGRKNATTSSNGGARSTNDEDVEVFSLEDLKVYLRGICDDQLDMGPGESSGSR